MGLQDTFVRDSMTSTAAGKRVTEFTDQQRGVEVPNHWHGLDARSSTAVATPMSDTLYQPEQTEESWEIFVRGAWHPAPFKNRSFAVGYQYQFEYFGHDARLTLKSSTEGV